MEKATGYSEHLSGEEQDATDYSERLSAEDYRVIRSTQWSRSGQYSPDDLIRAYVMGKEKGREERDQEKGREERDALGDLLRKHLGQALDEAERFYLDMRSTHEINPGPAFLRVMSFWPFSAEALYLVPVEEFISDAILRVYQAATIRSTELRCNDEDEAKCFDLVFRLMPMKESTDLNVIQTDFQFRYERKQESTP